MNYQLITDDEQLDLICHAARAHAQVALDTEFVRTRTYYPSLGLIQLYDGCKLSLIDPCNISQWQPFIDLLLDSQVSKYLHAAGEDLEVFQHQFQCLPYPLYDTQVMSMFLGFPHGWGFAAMVNQFCDITLDKSESRTDWLARPLTSKQCDYAAADVYYLLPIARQLQLQADEQQKTNIIKNECELIAARRLQMTEPAYAYLDIRNNHLLRPRQLAVLQRLAAWRLEYARQHNSAVNFVVREEMLWQVARYLPSSATELKALGLSGLEIRHHGAVMLQCVREAELVPAQQLPANIVPLHDMPGYKALFNDIKSLINKVSQQSGYSQQLLASRRQINQLIQWYWQIKPATSCQGPELINGWRGDLLGESIKSLLANY